MAYTPEQREELFTKIFSAIESGYSLRKALSYVKLSSKTFYEWLDYEGNEEKVKQYARACEDRADFMADEILDIADSSEGDLYVDDNGDTKIDGNTVQRARIQIDARKWLMSKMAPKKYGDKIQLGGDEDNPINVKFDITKVYREDQ